MSDPQREQPAAEPDAVAARRRRHWRRFAAFVITLVVLARVGWSAPRYAAWDRMLVSRSTITFSSGGEEITEERFLPRRRAPAGVVLLLHGSDGVMGNSVSYLRRYADRLARDGWDARVVHYFDRTHNVYSDSAFEDASFGDWLGALRDGITAAQAGHAHRPLAVVGQSLGAYLALALGATDRRVSAVVEISGGLADSLARAARHLPPTLILHGDADDIVPVREAYALERALRRVGAPFAAVIYPGQGHGFTGAAELDAENRLVRWLDATVGRRLPARTLSEWLHGR